MTFVVRAVGRRAVHQYMTGVVGLLWWSRVPGGQGVKGAVHLVLVITAAFRELDNELICLSSEGAPSFSFALGYSVFNNFKPKNRQKDGVWGAC